MKFFKAALFLVGVSILASCGQQDEPVVMVEPEPVYDKYGNQVN
ncbi:hypothetical protein [Marimonas arenosa]|uniref:Lipoprotein n=1 Tax=Marimonas arenosa TaxID=1795305 RepID=A0AAE3W9P0_9RHOB|nr:hypothetical protein [Marimonas arenosa]MDQ2088649.1 hypothetical protein [Marimonas arenosa]